MSVFRYFKLRCILCFLIISSCQRENNTFTEDEKIIVTAEVEQFFYNYFNTIRRKGLTGEYNYLDSSKEFFWVPPGFDKAISYDSVFTIIKQTAPQFSSVDNSIDSMHIIPLTSELASYTAKLRSVVEDTSGNISSMQLIETGVVIKRKNGWKLLHGQTSRLNNK